MGQGVSILATIRPDGDAYAARDVGDAGIEFEGRGEIVDDASGDILNFGLPLYLRQHNGELVTPEAGDGVGFTYRLFQASGGFYQ